jgi:hypothetical protein
MDNSPEITRNDIISALALLKTVCTLHLELPGNACRDCPLYSVYSGECCLSYQTLSKLKLNDDSDPIWRATYD